MRDLANFCGDIRGGNRSGKREFKLIAGAGFCFLLGQDARISRV